MAGLGSAKRFSGLSRDSFLLALASLFADISSEMLYPVLPTFLTQSLKAGGSIVGLVEGVSQAAQNIVQGFSGSLSDRLQRRKPVALFGYALGALAKPLIGFSTVWPVAMGARSLDRLGSGIRSAPRDALIAGSVAEAHRGKAFGLEGIGDNAGAFLGPLLAVALLAVWRIDMRWIFYLAVIPGVMAFLMILLVREAPAAPARAKAKVDIDPRRLPRPYRRYLVVTALFGIGNSSNAFLILQTQDLGASLPMTIVIYAAFNLVAAVISYPAGALSDRLGRRNILLVSFAVFLATYVGFAVIRSIAAAAAFFILYGVFQGVFRAVGKAMAVDFTPVDLRASGVGWYSATVGLSGLVASLGAGLLWDHVGHAAVFLYGAASAAVGIVALLMLIPARAEAPAP